MSESPQSLFLDRSSAEGQRSQRRGAIQRRLGYREDTLTHAQAQRVEEELNRGSVHLTDAEAVADAPRNITLRAMRGCAIVWFLPYRRAEGVIEIPDSAKEQSVEAIIIDDATGYGLPTGTRVLVSRTKGEGFNFTITVGGEDFDFCRIKGEGLYLVDETEAA